LPQKRLGDRGWPKRPEKEGSGGNPETNDYRRCHAAGRALGLPLRLFAKLRILQELTRCLDQHNRTGLSLGDKPVMTRRSHVTDVVPDDPVKRLKL
jgi:hypothetical protein